MAASKTQGNPNMWLYEKVRTPDTKAVKKFHNGKFGGDDTNPMWRIRRMTEIFGPCGQGWKIANAHYWSEDRTVYKNGQTYTDKMAFCTIDLYWKMDNGEWSEAVPGIGGNSFTQQGDEAYKGAFTDATSIACKHLGMCADVWFANDRTSKYFQYYDDIKEMGQDAPNQPEAAPSTPQPTPTPTTPVEAQLKDFGTTATDAQRKWAIRQIKAGNGDIGKKEMTAILLPLGFSIDEETWGALYLESYK